MWERTLEGFCGEEDGVEAGVVNCDENDEDVGEEGWLEDGESVIEASEPTCESLGPSRFSISPKYLSARIMASSWPTPAKATTIRSGWKNACRYFSTTALLIWGNRSCGQSRGFPNVLSL